MGGAQDLAMHSWDYHRQELAVTQHKLSHNFPFCISGEALKSSLFFVFFISVNSFQAPGLF